MILRVAFRALLGGRLGIEGEERIPAAGPLLVVSNHISNLDPLFYGAFFPRTLFAMAKRELFRPAPVSWFLGGCNVFPIDRGGSDRAALRTALQVLGRGGRLLMFVEGTRSRRPGMGRAQPGAGFLVRRSPGVPVLPAAVWGTERMRRLGGVHLRYGSTFVPEPPAPAARVDHQAVADELARRIAALLPAEYRGAYGREEHP